MDIYFDAEALQSGLEQIGGRLSCVLGNDNASHIQPGIHVGIPQAEYVGIVCDPKVAPYFILFYILRTDGNDNLRLIGKLLQHPELTVRTESRKYSGSMIIVK